MGFPTSTHFSRSPPLLLLLALATMIAIAARLSVRCTVTSQSLTKAAAVAGTRSFATPADHDEPDTRVAGLVMNPDAVASKILPGGNFVLKRDPRTEEDRKVFIERAFGYFWMMGDLGKSKSKPILSNTEIIPEKKASDFPFLIGLTKLDSDELVDIPDYFMKDNRASDPTAQCTLVTIAFKDYGYKLLSSWVDPFQEAFGAGNARARAMRISITEGRITEALLSGFMKRSFRSTVPPELHSQTLLFFGSDGLSRFIDKLRMYNTLTGYAFLLDGLGRIRFAGSGEASEKEARLLVQFAKGLTPRLREQQTS